jgi:NADH dehydrogenase
MTTSSILIVGGGFAGVWAALAAATARDELGLDIRITVATRDPYLTIRPRLYEPHPEQLRVPLDDLLAARGIELTLGEVTSLDHARRRVIAGARSISYDQLILASGSQLRRPEIPGARELAYSVDTYRDAMRLERHLAELTIGPSTPGRFTAVVVGAGLMGVEVATTMAGRLREVVLVERAPMVAPDLGLGPRPLVEEALRAGGVQLRLARSVVEVRRDHVRLDDGDRIFAATTVWTGGLYASELTSQLSTTRDELGRLTVDDFLRVKGVDGVFAAGDVARANADDDHVAPMSCQYAIPMGKRAGRNAVAAIVGAPLEAFRRPNYVTCVDLGAWGGLFTEGWERQVRLTGYWGKVMKETINTRLIYPPRSA